MKIAYITNAPRESGVGRAAASLAAELKKQNEFQVEDFSLEAASGNLRPWPGIFGAKPVTWWRLSRQLPKSGYGLWHFTNQSLSFVNRTPAVVTVHDLIELTDPQVALGGLASHWLYSGLPRAQHVICVSQYTREAVQKHFNLPSEKISIISQAASPVFQVVEKVRESLGYHDLLHRLSLTPEHKIVLYVGSEHPRKNLSVLVEAFRRVQKNIPEAVLVKVGNPGIKAGRAQFLRDLEAAGVRAAARLAGNLPDESLNLLYNIADVLVFPSRLEGFGFPPLEAMACGCPVVASNATSLPEVVGSAALTHDPDDALGFANSIERVLTDPTLAQDLRAHGLEQAKKFSWAKSAQETLEVYKRVAAK